MIWSETPPTTSGLYYAKHKNSDLAEAATFRADDDEWCQWTLHDDWSSTRELLACGYLFGPPIPTPEQCHEIAKVGGSCVAVFEDGSGVVTSGKGGEGMSIEQHAEAAAEEIVERYDEPHFDFVYESIATHMQAAIDEAIAPLKARVAALEKLGPLIDIYGSASWNDGYTTAEGQQRNNFKAETMLKITAILTGGDA